MELASPPMLSLTAKSLGDVEVIAVAGEIDQVTRATLREGLAATVARLPRGLVVDLTEVRFFGSVGLSALAWLQQTADAAEIPVTLVARQRSVLMPMAITGIDELFASYSTLEQAVEHHRAPQVPRTRHLARSASGDA
jgi:anti-anti-sigma factor